MTKYAKEPCAKCGWKFDGFHICLGLPDEVMKRVEGGPRRNPYLKDTKTARGKQRAKIASLYFNGEMTVREISLEAGLSEKFVISTLSKLADQKEITIRKTPRFVAKG